MAWKTASRMCLIGVLLMTAGAVMAQDSSPAAVGTKAPVIDPAANPAQLANTPAIIEKPQPNGEFSARDLAPRMRGVRQAGDNCESATVIPDVPYTDTGTTVGYADDYDPEEDTTDCPYNPSAAADVVYSFTPTSDMVINIDLCDSGYDTKVFVYADECVDPPAWCDDDGCGSAAGYTSILTNVAMTAGVTYYIVIDGYSGAAGEYALNIDLYEPPPDNCPEDSLFSQTYVTPDGDWSAGSSEVDPDYIRYESYEVTGQISSLRFWGLNAYNDGSGWSSCEEQPTPLEIKFYEDNAGMPGAVVCEYEVSATGVLTGDEYSGFPLYQYDVLVAPCSLMSGWVSIQGTGEPTCWFMWMNSSVGDGTSLFDDGTGITADDDDLSLCLSGEYEPTYGACCTDSTGACEENVEIINCQGAGQRFIENGACDDFDPPCGTILGACCYDDGSCQITTEAACTSLCGDLDTDGDVDTDDYMIFVGAFGLCEGDMGFIAAADFDEDGCITLVDFQAWLACYRGRGGMTGMWLGPNTTCDMCPCIVSCPDGAAPEQEPCGEDTNGGCNMDEPAFEPLMCGDVICGTGWYDGSTRDTDWFEVEVAEETELTITAETEFPALFGFLEQTVPGVAGCDNMTGYLEPYVNTVECEPSTLSMCVAPGTYYVFVGPTFDDVVECPADYVLSLECAPCTLPRGACCLEDGTCIDDLTEAECVQQDGEWQGEGVVCTPELCPVPGPGDNCADPLVLDLSELPYTESNTTCDRGNNYEETCLGSYDGGEDIIYEFTLDVAMCLQVNVVGSSWTGVVIDDSCPPAADCIAYGTASGGSPFARANLDPGTYYIMVDTYPSPDCTDFTLTIDECAPPPPNDDCVNATQLSGTVVDLAFDTTQATFDGLGDCMTSANVWYCYTAETTTDIVFSLCGSDYDTKLAIYDGCTCDPLGAELGCNDDSCGLQSELTLSCIAHQTYLVEVGGYSANTGTGILNISELEPPTGACCVDLDCVATNTYAECLNLGGTWYEGFNCDSFTCPEPITNDNCVDATAVGLVENMAFDTTDATFDGPGECQTSGNIWYCFTAENTTDLVISLCGSEYDTKLAVYDGCSCDPIGEMIVCNDDSCGLQSEVQIGVVADQSYLIEVGGYSSYVGLGVLTIYEVEPCIVDCPDGASTESEACGDDSNGGCNMDVPAFEPIACDEVLCGTIWADGGTRDTDWFEIVTDTPMILTWEATAEFPVVVGLVEMNTPGSGDCADSTGSLNPYATGSPCQEPAVNIVTDCLPAGTHWVFVSHQDYYDYPCGDDNDYVVTLTCEGCGGKAANVSVRPVSQDATPFEAQTGTHAPVVNKK